MNRELQEEIGRSIQIHALIGETIQFFYAANENQHYRMRATFFLAQFTDDAQASGEYELEWLRRDQIENRFFHDCHRWAVSKAAELIR